MIRTVVIVADAYPPLQTSAALQLRDLAVEFLRQGIIPTIITSDSGLHASSSYTALDGIDVLRVKTLKYKNIGHVRRALAEFLLPLFMIINFRKSALYYSKWDAVIWYSPTIFLGLFVHYLKKHNVCPSYLILRDIFPTWALDLGILKKGIAYYFFRIFERLQYSIADCIGVQATANLDYFKSWPSFTHKKIEVLQNWLSPKPLNSCSISIATLPVANRKIFVYAGNMGVAQGMGDLLILAEALITHKDIGFLFVGRGSDMAALKLEAKNRGLDNVVFCDEINPDEIPGLYAQCHVGLIALDARHKTHNIPGKFLSYLQSGLPVMAIVNNGNDLHWMIDKYRVGRATTDRSIKNLQMHTQSLLEEISSQDLDMSSRCKDLAFNLFSSKAAVEQIILALNSIK